jgi:decaprenylphospho-beta-D-erythro-pentofuranosid-2-ulose 2-reductase
VRDSTGTVQTILVLGGNSDIGVAIASRLARARQATVILAGRDPARLTAAAALVREAGADRVEMLPFDANDFSGHEVLIEAAVNLAGDLDVIVMAFGVLGAPGALDQSAYSQLQNGDGAGPIEVAMTNYVGSVSAGLAAARQLRRQGHGDLVVISSVAGQRVRQSNLVYGSSKAGLDGFAQGLNDALAGTGVHVLIVRPGWVQSRMTLGLRPAPLATTPSAVAIATEAALTRRHNVVWAPALLRPIFAVLRLLPSQLWRRVPG